MTYSTPREALLAQRQVLVDAIETLERHLVNVEHNIDNPRCSFANADR